MTYIYSGVIVLTSHDKRVYACIICPQLQLLALSHTTILHTVAERIRGRDIIMPLLTSDEESVSEMS